MKVLLMYPNIRHESLVPPSLALLSRILKNEGHDVQLFDSTNYDIELNLVDADRVKSENLQVIPYQSIQRISNGDVFKGLHDKVSAFGPDLIAMTSTESTFLLGVSLLKELRKYERIPTVLGGVFATFAPWLALRYPEIDMCAVGEGERSMPALCEAMQKGKDSRSLEGFWVKDGDTIWKNDPPAPTDINRNPTDLDISMFEDNRLYRPMAGAVFRMLSAETHRGCPFKCSFCNSSGQNDLFGYKAFFRKKSPEKVREEILYYRDEYRINYVFFWADTFLAWSDAEFDAFCEMYRDIKLPFWCQTRLETVTEEKIRRLMDLGLHFVSFGLEHGNEKFRREVVLRNPTNEVMVNACRIVERLGMPYNVNNIVGYPGETRELVFDTIELNRQINASSMSCSIFMPFHGTNLYRLSVERGYIPEDIICPSNNDEAIMNMSSMTRDEIMGLSKTFFLYRWFPKERWGEVRLAEANTPEGLERRKLLRKEAIEVYMPPNIRSFYDKPSALMITN